MLQSKVNSQQENVASHESSVRKRVEEIEKSRETNLTQPPSMYTSVAAPLRVWVVQEPNSYAYPTIFYKAPQALPCDSIIRSPTFDIHVEEAVNTIRADPRLAHLLEKSGIKLQRNYRLPAPPAICEEWWEEAERLIRRKNKNGKRRAQPKYGLGYVHADSNSSEEDEFNDPRRVMCRMISVNSNQRDNEDSTSDEESNNPCSYPLRSLCAAANAHQIASNEQYFLSRMYETLSLGEQGEVLDAAPAPQQIEDGGQLTIDELVEINLGT